MDVDELAGDRDRSYDRGVWIGDIHPSRLQRCAWPPGRALIAVLGGLSAEGRPIVATDYERAKDSLDRIEALVQTLAEQAGLHWRPAEKLPPTPRKRAAELGWRVLPGGDDDA